MFENYLLCVKNKNNPGFECKKFRSFNEADKFFHENFIKSDKLEKSTLLSVSNLYPTKIQELILHYKLSSIFIKQKIVD